jgi:ribonuclease J
VSHSIAGACAIAITCPAGTVIVSGDFKVDYTPIDGQVTDLQTFARYGERGVMAMLCESTNVERAGYTMSEMKIGPVDIGSFNCDRVVLVISDVFLSMLVAMTRRVV